MTSVSERTNTAVLVIDVQNEVVAAAHNRGLVVTNINSVVKGARSAGAPVIWVRHDDEGLLAESEGWQIIPELDPQPGEVIIGKNYRSSFEQTDLEAELARLDVGRLVVTGSQTDFCVRWTLHGALERGYKTVLVSDAHTTDETSPAGLPTGAQIIAHLNNTWASQATTTGASVVPAAEVTF